MKSYFNFLSRNKLYTAIEAVGLIVSLAFVILVGTYVYQQMSIAYENPYHNRTYFLSMKRYFLVGDYDKEAIDAEIPEVEASTRFSTAYKEKIKFNNEDIDIEGLYVDAEFFDMFPNYEFVAGSKEAFNDLTNIVVSERFAYRLAATPAEAVGKKFIYITRRDTLEMTVGAVLENFENTILPYKDVLLNFRTQEKYFWSPKSAEQKFNSWGGTLTAFRVVEGTNREEMTTKVVELCDKNYNHSKAAFREDSQFVLRTLPEAYLYEKAVIINCASKSMLQMLGVVVIALLVSAVFNYVNLTFALTGKRAREMATRRLLGAYKNDIFRRSILESVLFTVICFGVALLVAVAFEPTMNELIIGDVSQKQFIPISIGFTPLYIIIYLAGALLLGTVVGLLPAVNASRFKPIDVIKGSFRFKSKRVFSKIFIIVQSAISIILISMAILMEVQLSHMINRPNNVNTENIFALSPSVQASYKNVQPLIDKLNDMPFVKRIGLTSSFPGERMMSTSWQGEDGKPVEIVIDNWDSTYFRMLNPIIVEDFGHPLVGSLWLSESAAANLNYADTINGRTLTQYMRAFWGRQADQIGGIIKDIPSESASASEFNLNTVKFISKSENFRQAANLAIETIDESDEYKTAILEAHREFAKEKGATNLEPYDADYISDMQREQLKPAILTIRLVELFMILAVILSLLGMIAMSTYFSEQKSKEIAVRKVFGGTVMSETINNVRSYMLMVLIAAVIGVPAAVYAAEKYLERFLYKIENYWWIFVVAVILALAISLLSVLWQVLKAARTNPAIELKKE